MAALPFAIAILIAVCLAFVLGFAAHRGSVCMVRGVTEVLSARTGYMLISIGKSMLWVFAISLPLFWSLSGGLTGWQLTTVAVLGGFIFGAGAALNGACAYATMARLVDGEGGMLVAIAGFALGVLCFVGLLNLNWVARPVQSPSPTTSVLTYAAIVAAVALLWCLYELVRLWRTRPPTMGLPALALARQYRLSTTALVMGGATAALILLFGPLGYTSTFEQIMEAGFGVRGWPTPVRWVILASVLAGMLLSTVQRGTFRIDWRPRRTWIRNFFGGILMGLGVALIPGGNDALVLYGVPSLSPHALPAFLAMGIGVAAALILMRRVLGIETRASCRNDLFISDQGLGDTRLPGKR
jgi:uncharacterized membrane protein YedE/YeeE